MAAGDRIHQVKSPLPDINGKPPLILLRLAGKEELSRPFEYVVELFSEANDIDPTKLLGKPMAVSVRTTDDRKRFFHGLVSNFAYRGTYGEYSRYRAVLRPWIWFLTRNTDCRIFQDVSVRDVFEKVARDTHGFSDFQWKITGSYKTREFCVQYRESDFDFVNRLLEEEGVFYFFEHEETKHTLVFGGLSSAFSAVQGAGELAAKVPWRPPGEAQVELEHIYDWQVLHELQTGTVAIDDFDFTKPRVELGNKSSVPRPHDKSSYEMYDYPGLYWESGDGQQSSKVRMEEQANKYKRLAGECNHHAFNAGKRFSLVEHARGPENADYIVLKTEIEVESAEIEQMRTAAENRFAVKFVAFSKDDPFRPARVTRKPLVYGLQTAVVVGKAGEEIWTDQYGRVKLQFHWDREGQSDENSSCWIRVSQAWAGKNWGSMHIPRIGQEVVVSFLEGDPDRPLVIGRVYNADLMPPYGLPDNQTQSGILSRSTKGGTPETFNEMRFEDKKDEEKIFIHSQKDYECVIENNDSLKVGSSKAPDGSQKTEVWKNRTTDIKTGNDDTTIAQGNHSLKVTAGASMIEAAQKITIKVGASTITIEPAKISLSSPEIAVTGNAKIAASAPMTDVKGMASLILGGAMVKIN